MNCNLSQFCKIFFFNVAFDENILLLNRNCTHQKYSPIGGYSVCSFQFTENALWASIWGKVRHVSNKNRSIKNIDELFLLLHRIVCLIILSWNRENHFMQYKSVPYLAKISLQRPFINRFISIASHQKSPWNYDAVEVL